MYINQLPYKLQEEALKIAGDIQHPFNYILSEDSVLEKLEALDFNIEFEKQVTQTFLGKPLTLFGYAFKPITALMWHVLWCLGSPIVRDEMKDATLKDLDVFFYLLEKGFDGDFEKTARESECYCLLNFSADAIIHLPEVMVKLIKVAFHPLTFFPSNVHTEGKSVVMYDAEWISSVISDAHIASGESSDELMKKPLAYCFFFYLEWAKQNGVKNIERRPPDETVRMKTERICELLTDWFEKKGLISEGEKDEIYEKLTVKEKADG